MDEAATAALRKRVAIVTGAARGIGRAIALELGRRGCHVAFNYRASRDAADRLAGELAALGVECAAAQMDVADFAAAEAMVRDVADRFGRIDYLVNNAGIVRDHFILRMSERDWDEVLDTNLKGAFNFSKAVAPVMMKARFGAILNISSVSGVTGNIGQANYAASKAGLAGLTKTLARELAGRNVTVNALAFGLIDTEMTQGLPEEIKAKILQNIPLGRAGTAEEAARVAAFLLSDDARYITGQVVQADGGMAM
ncbi:MAG: 3-oxoacyl-[acyl-carrier-protein] reductase [Acidobacteriota bacterium]|jgi:3-oxoacyl-[acyl-carrier protein] reductase|nr:3-oxoacyl-[acyl-carrier-protein] reductase [Acidobacteriota bacterium]